MATSRDEVLADFQACTGIDDVGEAILHLEETNWNLLDAINRVMPRETQALPSEQQPSQSIPGLSMPLLFPQPVSWSSDMFLPLQGNSRTRMLKFNVAFRDRVVSLEVPDCEEAGVLKVMLHKEVGIPPCQQELRGWPSGRVSDSARLNSLSLPQENSLTLVTPEPPCVTIPEEDCDLAERLTQTYQLRIRDESANKTYNLNFPGLRTVRQVKEDVYSLTDIPVRHQHWTGWPPGLMDDSITLAAAGLNFPIHDLAVRRVLHNAQSTSVPKENKRVLIDLADSDNSSGEEFEDASESFTMEDDMFTSDVTTKRGQPLIPENIEDEAAACAHFAEQFSCRYGDCRPMFYQGTLDDAIKEACLKPAKERKLLAIYLHHDVSVLTNVFCTQLLCVESVVSFLSNNFIVWGWDATFETNKTRLINMIARNLGSVAAQTVRLIDIDKFPALIIVMRIRSTTEVFSVIDGTVGGVDELLTTLIQAVELFSDHQLEESREEEEREARETVKREQDEAYQISLEADRAKEEARQLMQKEEEMQKQKMAQEQKEMFEAKEAKKRIAEARLPPEPPEELTDISILRFRLPSGETLTRRFLPQHPLKVVFDFLLISGFPITEFKVLSSWPRRDLTTLNGEHSLEQLKLYPQETVTLEER